MTPYSNTDAYHAAPLCCMIEASISVGDPESLVLILGTKDQHLKQIREAIPASYLDA